MKHLRAGGQYLTCGFSSRCNIDGGATYSWPKTSIMSVGKHSLANTCHSLSVAQDKNNTVQQAEQW